MAEGLGDQMGIGGRCVGEAEGHPDELVLAEGGREGCLLPICLLDWDSMEGAAPLSAERILLPERQERLSAMLGRGNTSFLVTAFNFWQLMAHRISSLFFLGTGTKGKD